MKVFMIYVRDEDFYRLLPTELGDSRFSPERVQVMAFPPLGIETLAPIVRQHGHTVRMFDTCHPQMKAEHIAEAVIDAVQSTLGVSVIPGSLSREEVDEAETSIETFRVL